MQKLIQYWRGGNVEVAFQRNSRNALEITEVERDDRVPPCSGSWPADESVVRQLGRSHAPKDPAKEEKRVLH